MTSTNPHLRGLVCGDDKTSFTIRKCSPPFRMPMGPSLHWLLYFGRGGYARYGPRVNDMLPP